MRIPAWVLTLFLVLCAFAPGSASAQAGGVYAAVVEVDESAATAVAARDRAWARARELAWPRLVERLASAEEFQRLGVPAITPQILERVAVSTDIVQERASATRYIAKLAINFNPNLVRQLLAEAGYQVVIDQRAAPRLLVPILAGGGGAFAPVWQSAWAGRGFERELQPLAVSFAVQDPNADWAALQAPAAEAGAASALLVLAQARGPVLEASLVEVGPEGLRRDLGQLSARIGAGEDGFKAAFEQLALLVNAKMQAEYKQRLLSGAVEPGSRLTVEALYANLAEWLQLKKAMEAAARTLVSDVRIDAVSPQGALVSLGFAGSFEQLQADFARSGGRLERTPTGAQLRLGARPAR